MEARKLVVVAVVVVLLGGGVALWLLVGSSPPTPAVDHVPVAVARPTPPPPPDAALRRAVIAPAVRPADPEVIPPPGSGSGGFSSWTGLEGTRPGELEAAAKAQGVPLDVARESRRLLWMIEGSQNRPLVDKLVGHTIDDAAWNAVLGAGNDALRTATQLMEDLRGGSVDGPTAIAQQLALETEYRAELLRRTGLSDAQFDQLFANLDVGHPDGD